MPQRGPFAVEAPIAEQMTTRKGLRAAMAQLSSDSKLEQIYWICAMSVNQHVTGSVGASFQVQTIVSKKHCFKAWWVCLINILEGSVRSASDKISSGNS